MTGSYSIKNVYPALVRDLGLSYSNLAIHDDGVACQSYESLHHDNDPDHISGIRNQLLEYCHLDTM